MYCVHCGVANPDDAEYCAACGRQLVRPGATDGPAPPPVRVPAERVPNYLALAILTTLCVGILPFGVLAIIYASRVDGKMALGDITGAKRDSRLAKMWCWISFGLWLLCVGAYLSLPIFHRFHRR